MSTAETAATAAKPPKRRALRAHEADQCVTLRFIGWDGYRRVLRARGERPRPLMIYLDGALILMSPGHSHEVDGERFAMLVVEVAKRLRIPFHAAGSTTYRRRKKQVGIEPDNSYYFENLARVRGKRDIDLRTDPPPDLMIEVVYSHAANAAVEVSRRLGVPEVWVCTEKELQFLVLGPDGNYAPSATSRAFPVLTTAEALSWVRRPAGDDESDLEWIEALARWVQETLVPRAANQAN